MGGYLTSASFGVDVAENWQSEYLQFLLYIWATVWLGSAAHRNPRSWAAKAPSNEQQRVGAHADARSPAWAKAGGVRTGQFSNSLLLVMGLVFLGSGLAQSVDGLAAFKSKMVG